ncbi:erythroblast NAD(P)(+)--arginine ADP-ribosyltransferase-like [Megalobrama amblycephala]|uniref:erythroblast NAD(P)(+)--arginine ADP-ribosyltransferase-like n=1 Tax=Megalobrama amblycephala TaxID=75352 RepID=UPI0020141324|nr:erythroblast NAD(P)(+)--arginine ADP-ribosyltransferase-like [Megalobrama amblycephala]
MLLIIEALLLILAALGQDHRAAAGQKYPLNMALNSVDDQYMGCREKMEKLVETKYLKKEIKDSSEFRDTWHDGENKAKKPQDNLKQIHSVAIYVYTNNNSHVYRNFNNAVRGEKQKYKDQKFKWYSLHFLLTEAVQILKKTQNKCYSTYRGSTVEFDKIVPNTKVRFGSFTSSSLDRKVANDFGLKSCFEIETCEGADVIKYSKYPDQKEVLIPPYEKFTVVDVKTKGQEGAWCDTVFKLKSSGKKSYLNCGADVKLVQDRAKL